MNKYSTLIKSVYFPMVFQNTKNLEIKSIFCVISIQCYKGYKSYFFMLLKIMVQIQHLDEKVVLIFHYQ